LTVKLPIPLVPGASVPPLLTVTPAKVPVPASVPPLTFQVCDWPNVPVVFQKPPTTLKVVKF
jgi:hypothetical protein